MGRSQDTFSKREKEKKKLRKRQEKQRKKEERKANSEGGDLENMIAYVDEFGNILDSPPEEKKKEEIDADNIIIGAAPREEETETEHKGRVDFFNDSRGYGFIRDLLTQEKYFFHVNNVEYDDIMERDQVTFEIEKGPKGLNAIKVKKV